MKPAEDKIKVFDPAFFKKLAGSRGSAPGRSPHKQAASELASAADRLYKVAREIP